MMRMMQEGKEINGMEVRGSMIKRGKGKRGKRSVKMMLKKYENAMFLEREKRR